jgi:hypothetical protein
MNATTLSKGHRLRKFGKENMKRMLESKQEKIMRVHGIVKNFIIFALYKILLVKSRRKVWSGHVATIIS